MLHQNTIQRANERLVYLRNLSLVRGNIVKTAKVDKNDALVKRIISRLVKDA
jgi:hypothetical protein